MVDVVVRIVVVMMRVSVALAGQSYFVPRVGSEVTFTCQVENISNYKVGAGAEAGAEAGAKAVAMSGA